jgi:Xaa-Pro aminopeptidase
VSEKRLSLTSKPSVRRRQRRAQVMDNAAAMGIGAFLLTDPTSIFYLSGFTGSNGALVLGSDQSCALVTDRRYEVQSQQEATVDEVILDRDTLARAAQRAAQDAAGVRTGSQVGFEADHLTVASLQQLRGLVSSELLSPTTGIVAGARRAKDTEEIDTIAHACQISETALASVVEGVQVGDQEIQIALKLEFAMRKLGASDRAFDTIVATGSNSAIPHHTPTSRRIDVGDLLKIDFGAKLGHYHSDITRTFIVGRPPDAEQRAIYAAVADAASQARDVLRSGLPGNVPYHVARDVFASQGWAENFTHGLGHGIGLQIHEAPIMGAACTRTLVTGDVVTVEPGIYFPGRGGVRVEDTLVVTGSGSRTLSNYPRDLIRVG